MLLSCLWWLHQLLLLRCDEHDVSALRLLSGCVHHPCRLHVLLLIEVLLLLLHLSHLLLQQVILLHFLRPLHHRLHQ